MRSTRMPATSPASGFSPMERIERPSEVLKSTKLASGTRMIEQVGQDILIEQDRADDWDLGQDRERNRLQRLHDQGVRGTPKMTRWKKAQKPSARMLMAVPVTIWCCFR